MVLRLTNFTEVWRKKFERCGPSEDLTPLHNAYLFAAERHGNQKRKSGEPYITHPIAVAKVLTEMQMDLVSLQTGLLHDVVEDTSVKIEEIKERFGEDVARCVDGVTKLSKIRLANREDRQAESIRKMLLAMTGDIRVVIVKLADRLHNLRTIKALPADRQIRIAQETIEIYAPDRASPGNGQSPRRTRGFVLSNSGAGSVRRAGERDRIKATGK